MTRSKIFLTAILTLTSLVPGAVAEIVTEDVEYSQGDTTLQGYLAYDNAVEGPRPGVLIVHNWMGLQDYEMRRARQLAELGYVAFALDIYGKGVRPENRDQAAAESGKYKNDRKLLRERAAAGLEQLRSYDDIVQKKNIAAIGYCFGGMTVLEMARAGMDLPVAVSFHGSLTPGEDVETTTPIETEIIVLHGAVDPYAPRETVTGLMQELDDAGATYSIVLYSDAVHSFTEKEAGDDPSTGAAYNERADQRSWAYMKMVFDQTIGLPGAETSE